MKKIFSTLFIAALVLSCTKGEEDTNTFRPITPNSSKYISKIIDYKPAPGQFIDDAQGLGDAEAAESIVGGTTGMVSLGAYGGSITFQFDHTVLNNEGMDFSIKGNAFETSSEPGIVMVSFDENSNGIADDTWYELKGENYSDATTIKNYELTYYKPANLTDALPIRWTDNQGGSGQIDVNGFGSHASHVYYPLWAHSLESFTVKGTYLKVNAKTEDGVNMYNALGMGYADNASKEYTLENGNLFDISNAINNNGESVYLKGIDFIKVYTAVQHQFVNIGEASTEVCGAISLSIK